MNSKFTVYVVDDDSDVRISLFYALTTLGFSVRPWSSGQEFLKDSDDLKPGCVLLDMRMPGISGLDVIEALARRREELPIIVITGHGDVKLAVKAMKLGASDFIEKPFEEERLIAMITQVTEKLEGSLTELAERADAVCRIAMLSSRESEVLRALAAGLSNKVIAFNLGLSVRTVEMHRTSMMQRLQVKTLPAALGLAYLSGMHDGERPWAECAIGSIPGPATMVRH